MAELPADRWRPTAAYLYVLHLDGPALAWEYLRRHPDYRHDWVASGGRLEVAARWGLRQFEDPNLDAREAHALWFPEPDTVIQLYPDADPPPDALPFMFWSLPGRKHLILDGHRMALITRWPGCYVRLALASGLEDGMAYIFAVRACADPRHRYHLLAGELEKLFRTEAASSAVRPRPSASALLHLHTLQALDGILAGASLRTVADVLVGAEAVAGHWHADGALRARVRRLVRRGQMLMRGGYRRLTQLPHLNRDVAHDTQNVPEQNALVSRNCLHPVTL